MANFKRKKKRPMQKQRQTYCSGVTIKTPQERRIEAQVKESTEELRARASNKMKRLYCDTHDYELGSNETECPQCVYDRMRRRAGEGLDPEDALTREQLDKRPPIVNVEIEG
jgi:hypothetical protein